MISIQQIKHIKSLQQKKFREEANVFVVETPKIVEDVLDSSYPVEAVYGVKSWVDANWKRFARHSITEVSEKELERISGLQAPNQVLAVVRKPDISVDTDWFSETCLVLDEIRDPGNFGTILRIADWFGIKHILCSNGCVEFTNPKCIQASMGSFLRVSIRYGELTDILSQKPERMPVYGTFMEGENIYQTDLELKSCIVIGNEAHGISPLLESFITKKVHIPSFSTDAKHAESLNASVATAIFCSELKRR
ncbi:MAG: RNA methyltransferase [Bacteroidales bacterium]|jgi:TrmH family RNA methyltransferase|nr:RNA methyltransferase [Bacteroidales bacterium]